MTNPIICSVIISAYNAEKYILESLYSILNQSISNIELIVINDASSDSTWDIIASVASFDPRVIAIDSKQNKGQALQFNDALKIAKGEFISFFDADDIAIRHKLKSQILFLRENADYAMVGCNLYRFGSDNMYESELLSFSETYGEIQADNLFRCPIISGSLVIRANVIRDLEASFHNVAMGPDWDFVDRLLPYVKAYNIQEPLFYYRTHGGQTTSSILEKDTISFDTALIRVRALARMGVIPSEDDLKVHLAISPNRYWAMGDHHYLKELPVKDLYEAWLDNLLAANKLTSVINQWSLDQYIGGLRQDLQSYFN